MRGKESATSAMARLGPLVHGSGVFWLDRFRQGGIRVVPMRLGEANGGERSRGGVGVAGSLLAKVGVLQIWPDKGARISVRLFPASRSVVEGRAMPDLDWVECSKVVWLWFMFRLGGRIRRGSGFVHCWLWGLVRHWFWVLVPIIVVGCWWLISTLTRLDLFGKALEKVGEGCCRGRVSQNPTRRWWLSYKTKTEQRRNKTEGLMIGVEWSLSRFGD
ncbi:hypothetical protein AKJ16_DCAP15462 [Drosera capensis]